MSSSSSRVTLHQWRKSGQEPGGTDWNRGCGGAQLTDSLSLLSSTTQEHLLRVSTAQSEPDPLTSIIKQSNARRLAYRPSDVDFFLKPSSLFTEDSSLYQVENKGKTKTKQENKEDSCPTSWCPCSFQKDRDKGRMFYSNSSLTLMADREASTKSLEFPEWLVHTECLLLFILSFFFTVPGCEQLR